jgi:prepilin-type N-terminal cleavage/methylation domain-containing protein
MKRAGFTLIECLIGLSIALFVLTAGLQFYVGAQKLFTGLKAREEGDQAALAALDRMRIDLLHAGRGLIEEVRLGLVSAAEAIPTELRIMSAERTLHLAAGAGAGATRLRLLSTAEIATGQMISLRDGAAGELRRVVHVEADEVVLEAPLERGYAPDSAGAVLIETVTFYLDGPARILRRKVNASPAQPLVENAAAATWTLTPSGTLARIRLELTVKGVHPHEATVFLKNAALAGTTGP